MSSCQNQHASLTGMTKMKALSMLDHVMLWVGRLFAIRLMIGSALKIIPGWENDFHGWLLLMEFALAFFWTFSLLLYTRSLARLFLGTTSLICLLIVPFGLARAFFDSHFSFTRVAIYTIFDGGILCIGLFSILWIALRSPYLFVSDHSSLRPASPSCT